MKKTFIIATTGDRYDSLMILLKSIYRYLKNGWCTKIVCQAYTKKQVSDIKLFLGMIAKDGDNDIISFDNLIGAHSAKVYVLNNYSSDVWCSLDDDMEAIQKTDFDKMANILMEDKSIGFVSGNWARTFGLSDKKEVKDKLVSQILVFTGGGLLFRDDVAEIIRNMPNEQYYFDDCLWAVYAYINGYTNYRYLGSVLVHNICTKGGRRTWVAVNKSKKILPPEEYLITRKAERSNKDGYDEYYICLDKDVTEYAKQLHRENKKEK